MSVTWNCSDDSVFVRQALKQMASNLGLVPEQAKFSDFSPRIQSAILSDAAQLKKEYHKLTAVIQ